MQKVLVTGGCGFLGSHIVRSVLDRGAGPVRVLALPDESTLNVEGLDVEIIRGNVLSIEDCKKAVEGIDTVFHAAAIYKGFMPDPSMMYEVNNRGTFNMMEASRRAGVDKVIYTASRSATRTPNTTPGISRSLIAAPSTTAERSQRASATGAWMYGWSAPG